MIEAIFEKLSNLPDKFWQRLFMVFAAYIGAQIAIRILPIPFMADESFLVALFAIFSFIGIYLIPKILINPFLNYIIIQLMFFWIVLDVFLKKTAHISAKPHAAIFGFAIVAGIIYFFKNFDYLWKFITFRFLFIFFVINIIYYFCYYSDFNVNLVNLTAAGGFSEDQAAKTVIFLDSLAVFVSSIVSLSLLAKLNNKIELDSIIYKTSKILCVCSVLSAFIYLFIGERSVPGVQIYLPIYFFLILGFKYYIDNMEKTDCEQRLSGEQSSSEMPFTVKLSNLITFSSIVLFGIMIKICNKSSLIAILAAIFLFVLINYKLNLKFYIPEFLKNKKSGIIFSILLAGLLIFIAIKFNIPEIVQKKLEGTFNSLTGGGINSYYIRKSNWRLFGDYWINNLNTFNCLFGFGIGKSREIIYYITQSQYSSLYYVQTTHNHYMDMFFDYGAVALFYFTPLILIFYRNILNLISKNTHNNIKLISNTSCCLIIFYFIYHYSDGLRVPTAIIFFSSLMLLEGLKFKLQLFQKR